MTNAKKYLKDGADIKQMATEMVDYFNFPPYEGIGEGSIEAFFDKEIKPTLTEDERVILRNIQNSRYGYTHIARTQADSEGGSDLYIFNDDDKFACDNILCFDHLFQFIKERRKILY